MLALPSSVDDGQEPSRVRALKPLCIDLYCGLGGWAEGFLSEGWDVIGFDIERHDYGTGGYPGQLVLQDVTTLHGAQFKDAAVIVASPPCQAYSYRAMPWGALWLEHARMDDDGAPAGNYQGKDPIYNDLFRACLRIQREASESAGRHIPMIIENVKGAQPFVGSAAWHHGSFFLWGDIPALMPITLRSRKSQHTPLVDTPAGTGKTSWFFGNSKRENRNYEMGGGVKVPGQKNGEEYAFTRGPAVKNNGGRRLHGKNSDSRKAASAQVAKIPFPLARHIAEVYRPVSERERVKTVTSERP